MLGKIVGKFLSKGYTLADTFLYSDSKTVSNIQFIFGIKDRYCLPEKDYKFGVSNKCVYSKSPLGVFLKGDSLQLTDDLSYLESINKNIIESTVNMGKLENIEVGSILQMYLTILDSIVIVHQLNLYLDYNGLIRIKSKFKNIKNTKRFDYYSFPYCHNNMGHSGVYGTVSALRKLY